MKIIGSCLMGAQQIQEQKPKSQRRNQQKELKVKNKKSNLQKFKSISYVITRLQQ